MSGSVAIVSPYRLEGAPTIARGDSALNAYTRFLALALGSQGVSVDIVAPGSGRDNEPWLESDQVRVHPTFRRGSIAAPAQIFKRVLQQRASVVHVQHELFAFGGIETAAMVPSMMQLIRTRRKRIVTTIHGVLPLDRIDKEFIKRNGIKGSPRFVRTAWRSLLRSVVNSSDIVHVHEERHAAMLRDQYCVNGTPIEVIPHGVPAMGDLPERRRARELLGIPAEADVLLFFGFHASYKGLEIVYRELSTMLRENGRLHVLICGETPSRLRDEQEKTGGTGLDEELAPRLRMAGFVEDKDVSLYYCAADALMLPYTVHVASSGPFGLAVAHGLPVLFSEAFRESYPSAPLIFSLAEGGLSRAALRFFDSGGEREAAERFIRELKPQLEWSHIATRFAALYGAI